jgi:hypothetical protein
MLTSFSSMNWGDTEILGKGNGDADYWQGTLGCCANLPYSGTFALTEDTNATSIYRNSLESCLLCRHCVWVYASAESFDRGLFTWKPNSMEDKQHL